MNKRIEENWCQHHLTNEKLWQLLTKIDTEFAQAVLAKGCVHPECGGKLHRADIKRKPQGLPKSWTQSAAGGPDYVRRASFCCDQDGCRRRHTPKTVRFLGRRVYAGFVVVLVSAMTHGLKPARVQQIRELLGIDPRTLERWRQWWLTTFVQGSFWQAARARFMPGLCERTLPWSLGLRFEIERLDRLLDLLKFLAPLTQPATGQVHAM